METQPDMSVGLGASASAGSVSMEAQLSKLWGASEDACGSLKVSRLMNQPPHRSIFLLSAS